MHPFFEAKDISSEGISKVLEMKLTLKEFEAWFTDFKDGRLEAWWKNPPLSTLVIKTTSSEDELEIISLDLGTHKILTAQLGIFTSPPKLSFDSEDDNLKDEEGLSVEDKTTLLATFCMERFGTLKQKWTQTFLEVEAGYSSVVSDLKLLQTYASGCKRLIGYPDAGDAGERTTLWSKIYQLSDILRNHSTDVERFNNVTADKFHELQRQQEALRQDVHVVSVDFEASTRGLEEVIQASISKI